MRRLPIVCALAVIGSAVVAYSLPRGSAQDSAPSLARVDSASTAVASQAVVVADGIDARALAIDVSGTTSLPSIRPALYLTAASQPNRVLTLSAAAKTSGAAGALAASGSNAQLVPIAGAGEAGSLGDGGGALAAQLNLKSDSLTERSGVAVAPDGTMFIADTHNATIRRIAGSASSEPGVIRSVAGRWAPRRNIALVEPMGIALDRAGNLYIADHGANAVLVLRGSASATTGDLELLAHVAAPASIAVTPNGGKVFVASPESGSVFAIAASTRAIEELSALSVTEGQATNSIACRATAGGRGICPAGLAVDGAGNLFAADMRGGNILRVDAATAKVTLARANFSAPGEIEFDADGNLFLTEQGRSRIAELHHLGVPLSGVTLSPSSNDFGNEPTGGTTPTFAFTLANNTSSTITSITSMFQGTNGGDFQNSSSSCAASLPANMTCAFNVAFAPAAPTATPLRQAQLAVSYFGAASALTSDLTGTADDFNVDAPNDGPTTLSVNAGDPATYMLEITPDAIFGGTVTLVCPSSLPRLTTCAFNSGNTMNITSIEVTPGTPVPFQAVFQTTSRNPPPKTWMPFSPGDWAARPLPFPAGIALLAILVGGALAAGCPNTRRVVSTVALFIGMVALLGGCGHHSSTTGTTGTPAGKSVLNIVVNSQGAGRGITLTLFVD